MPRSRRCGHCTECCTSMAVPSLAKRAGDPCPHQGRDGCLAYDDRPAECRAMLCVWVRGGFKRKDRPDLSRVVVVQGGSDALGTVLQVFPSSDGAERRGRGATVVAACTRVALTMLMLPGSRRVLGGPEHQVRKALALIEQVTGRTDGVFSASDSYRQAEAGLAPAGDEGGP